MSAEVLNVSHNFSSAWTYKDQETFLLRGDIPRHPRVHRHSRKVFSIQSILQDEPRKYLLA